MLRPITPICKRPLLAVLPVFVVASLGPWLARAHTDHSSADVKCPGSPASSHAWLAMEASVSASCASAKEEMNARVAGQGTSKWVDPHNNGKYTLVSDSSEGVTFTRLSANGFYTDKMLFTFETKGTSCWVTGCSESQGASGGDQSTNLCNLWNLICTPTNKCCHMLHDLGTFSYRVTSKSSGAGSSQSVCLGGGGGSGGGALGQTQTSCPESDSPTASTALEHSITWTKGFSGKAEDQTMAVKNGEVLKFVWTGGHNVYLMKDKAAFDACDFSTGTNLGAVSPLYHTMGAATTYFACQVGTHCSSGQKLSATIVSAGGSTIESSTTISSRGITAVASSALSLQRWLLTILVAYIPFGIVLLLNLGL